MMAGLKRISVPSKIAVAVKTIKDNSKIAWTMRNQ